MEEDMTVVVKELQDLDSDTLMAGIINRLMSNMPERCHVLWLRPSDFANNPTAARVFLLVMAYPGHAARLTPSEVAHECSNRADFEAVRYIETELRSSGQPFSAADLIQCSLLLHDRSLISRYNQADGERATQAWVDSVEESLAAEFGEWPEPDDEE